MNGRLLGGLVLMLLLPPSSAEAQQHKHKAADSSAARQGGMMMQGMTGSEMEKVMMSMMGGGAMMMPMATVRAAMRFQPRHILEIGETLQLTPQQISELEGLADEQRSALDTWGDTVREESQSLKRLLEATQPDPKAVGDAAHKVLAPHVELHVRLLTDAAAVRQILTPDQVEKVLSHQGMGMMMHKDSGQTQPTGTGGHTSDHGR